jgi:hypothetical protein
LIAEVPVLQRTKGGTLRHDFDTPLRRSSASAVIFASRHLAAMGLEPGDFAVQQGRPSGVGTSLRRGDRTPISRAEGFRACRVARGIDGMETSQGNPPGYGVGGRGAGFRASRNFDGGRGIVRPFIYRCATMAAQA